MAIEIPSATLHLTPSESWQRAAITQSRELPNVSLLEFSKIGDVTGFKILTDVEAIGFFWVKNLHASRFIRAEVFLSLLSSTQGFPVSPDDHIYEKYRNKGYGLATYLIGLEHVAEQGRRLKNGRHSTAESISLWQRLVQYGVAECKREPKLSIKSANGQPDFYNARYVTKIKQ